MFICPHACNKTEAFQTIVSVFEKSANGIVITNIWSSIYHFIITVIGKTQTSFELVLGTSDYAIENKIGIKGFMVYVVLIETIKGVLVMGTIGCLKTKTLVGQIGKNVADLARNIQT